MMPPNNAVKRIHNGGHYCQASIDFRERSSLTANSTPKEQKAAHDGDKFSLHNSERWEICVPVEEEQQTSES